MPGTRLPYAPEFREQMVALVRAGRSPESREFESTAQTIHNWLKQADLDEGDQRFASVPRSGDRLGTCEAFEFVRANQAEFAVRTLCRVLGVSPSGYYAWWDRPASEREVANARLLERMREIHEFSRRTYGRPRMYAELRDDGWRVNQACGPADGARRYTGREQTEEMANDETGQGRPPAPDLVERDFAATVPDQLWVADITYVPTWSGFLYLAVVVDAYSRRVVGWSMETHLRTDLVLQALNMALWQRRPESVIHHSDQGCQYTSIAFGLRCKQAGVRPSMGSVGDAYDNAMCESFFATLECELLEKKRFRNQAEAKMAVFDFIEAWYNPHRRHSALGQMSPLNYERRHASAA